MFESVRIFAHGVLGQAKHGTDIPTDICRYLEGCSNSMKIEYYTLLLRLLSHGIYTIIYHWRLVCIGS